MNVDINITIYKLKQNDGNFSDDLPYIKKFY